MEPIVDTNVPFPLNNQLNDTKIPWFLCQIRHVNDNKSKQQKANRFVEVSLIHEETPPLDSLKVDPNWPTLNA